MGINTGSAASLHCYFNQKLGGQFTVLFASSGIPLSQEERSGCKREREFESFPPAGQPQKIPRWEAKGRGFRGGLRVRWDLLRTGRAGPRGV
jgi:hypothetical protein